MRNEFDANQAMQARTLPRVGSTFHKPAPTRLQTRMGLLLRFFNWLRG